MKIESSAVNMQSSHSYVSVSEKKAATLISSGTEAATLSFSKKGMGFADQLNQQKKEINEDTLKKKNENVVASFKQMQQEERKSKSQSASSSFGIISNNGNTGTSTKMEFKLQLLLKFMEAMNRSLSRQKDNPLQDLWDMIYGKNSQSCESGNTLTTNVSAGAISASAFHVSLGSTQSVSGAVTSDGAGNMRANLAQSETETLDASMAYGEAYRAQTRVNGEASDTGSVDTAGFGMGQTKWVKTTAESSFFAEVEATTFQAQGIAKTADGREISFQANVEMSRGFSQTFESLSQEEYIMCDPLVINLDGNPESIGDQKFLFDLDTDGKKDTISFTNQGSGFLTLDKNDDGKVNDGSELFGTKSGDGFKDLAAYDTDHNGWIDEGDAVYGKLRIWTKDENGSDQLLTLKQSDVGAIYLGSASTEYSLNDRQTNETNGVIRSTGIYLKDSGGTGTLQHVDLAL